MKRLILLLTAVLAALVIMLLSSMGQAQPEPTVPALILTGESRNRTQAAQYNAKLTQAFVATESQAAAHATAVANGNATRAAKAKNADVDADATALHVYALGTVETDPDAYWSGCGGSGGGYHDAAHKAACDAHRAEYQARYGNPCRTYDGTNWVCLHDAWTGPLPASTPNPSGPSESGGPTGPGGPSEPGDPTGPGGPTGSVHTVGESLFDIDAAATALHQMIHSPDATPAFRSICDLPPRGPADVAACDLYKAAYKLKYGNPCRHNDEGEAVCLH